MVSPIDESRIKQIKPFADLSATDRKALAGVLDEFSAARGTTLVRQGECGHAFMVIEEGTAEVFRDGARIDSMGPGDFFGELAVIDEVSKRDASVVATSPVRVLALTAYCMRVVREDMPQIADQIERVIADHAY